MRQPKNKVQLLRYIILTLFFLIVTSFAFLHFGYIKGLPFSPSIDAICPFGGLETIYQYLSHNEYLQRTQLSNFILLGGTILLVLIGGRFFCGFICIIGFLQEICSNLVRKIFKFKTLIIPQNIEFFLRLLKYFILIAVLYFTWQLGELIIRPYDPFAAYSHIFKGAEVFQDFLIGFIILVSSLLLSIFFERFFCKYLCPMGAFLGLFTKISPYHIRRDDTTCIHCFKCNKSCPMNIEIENKACIHSAECINCMLCISKCPTKKNTLYPSFFKKKIKIFLLILIALFFYAAVSVSAMIFKPTTDNKHSSTEVSITKTVLPASNIKGFMTLEEIAVKCNISLEQLYEKLKITKDKIPPQKNGKEIKALLQEEGRIFEVEEIREKVKELQEKKY